MKTPFIISIIQKVAEQLGALVIVDPEYKSVGHITFKNGTKTVFRAHQLILMGLAQEK
jgi:hypothetical protein